MISRGSRMPFAAKDATNSELRSRFSRMFSGFGTSSLRGTRGHGGDCDLFAGGGGHGRTPFGARMRAPGGNGSDPAAWVGGPSRRTGAGHRDGPGERQPGGPGRKMFCPRPGKLRMRVGGADAMRVLMVKDLCGPGKCHPVAGAPARCRIAGREDVHRRHGRGYLGMLGGGRARSRVIAGLGSGANGRSGWAVNLDFLRSRRAEHPCSACLGYVGCR